MNFIALPWKYVLCMFSSIDSVRSEGPCTAQDADGCLERICLFGALAPLVHPAPSGLSPLQILGTTCSWTALASSPTSASVTATLPSCSATAMSSRVRADSSYCCHKLPLSRYEYVSMGLRHMNPKPCAAVAESIGCQVDVKWLWPSV